MALWTPPYEHCGLHCKLSHDGRESTMTVGCHSLHRTGWPIFMPTSCSLNPLLTQASSISSKVAVFLKQISLFPFTQSVSQLSCSGGIVTQKGISVLKEQRFEEPHKDCGDFVPSSLQCIRHSLLIDQYEQKECMLKVRLLNT